MRRFFILLTWGVLAPATVTAGSVDYWAVEDAAAREKLPLMFRDRVLPTAPNMTERPVYNSAGYPKFYDYEGYPANKPPWGTLNCLDLNTGKLLWKVPLGEYPELSAQGAKPTGTENYGGAIVTAGGLVFCSGTRDCKIRAFDKDTGVELWSAKLPWVGNARPAAYQIKGRQYIVIAASGGNKLGTPYGDAYVAFALPPIPKWRSSISPWRKATLDQPGVARPSGRRRWLIAPASARQPGCTSKDDCTLNRCQPPG
jgi:hypothetical protein